MKQIRIVLYLIPPLNECFWGYTEIIIPVCQCVRPSVYKILLSVKALVGLSSHIQ